MRTFLHPRRGRTRRVGLLVGALILLAAAISATVGVVAAAIGAGATADRTPPSGKISTQLVLTPIAGRKGHATCDEPGQPTCPPLPNFWRPITSDSPSAVLAALPSLPGYLSPPHVASLPAADSFSFDMPVLVLPATTVQAATTAASEDNNLPHFVIRASVNGVRMITYDVTYNPSSHEIGDLTFGGDPPNSPHYNKPFPFAGVSASAAIATLHTVRGVSVAAGKQPQLVFFALNPDAVNPAHPLKWFGGGESPENPIWRLKGSDGLLYFVGGDGQLYLPRDLPVVSGAAFTQP